MSPETHLERAAEAAVYADRLSSDLASLADALARYPRTPATDMLRERGRDLQAHLKAISARLSSLGQSADHGKYTLSEAEHDVLDDASELREQMMEVLHDTQRLRPQ
jgi:hypothetical protein